MPVSMWHERCVELLKITATEAVVVVVRVVRGRMILDNRVDQNCRDY